MNMLARLGLVCHLVPRAALESWTRGVSFRRPNCVRIVGEAGLISGPPPVLISARRCCHASDNGEASTAGSFKLIVYSKQECPLCDKLKDKLEALIGRAAFSASPLANAQLEVRDITSNSQWEAAFSLSIPVMAFANSDGGNEVNPNLQLRASFIDSLCFGTNIMIMSIALFFAASHTIGISAVYSRCSRTPHSKVPCGSLP